MGYDTLFKGSISFDRPIKKEHAEYIMNFKNTRRTTRNALIASKMKDPKRISAGLEVGLQGGYFTGGVGFMGQDDDKSTINPNVPPKGQPSLWCQWAICTKEQEPAGEIEEGVNYILAWDGGVLNIY